MGKKEISATARGKIYKGLMTMEGAIRDNASSVKEYETEVKSSEAYKKYIEAKEKATAEYASDLSRYEKSFKYVDDLLRKHNSAEHRAFNASFRTDKTEFYRQQKIYYDTEDKIKQAKNDGTYSEYERYNSTQEHIDEIVSKEYDDLKRTKYHYRGNYVEDNNRRIRAVKGYFDELEKVDKILQANKDDEEGIRRQRELNSTLRDYKRWTDGETHTSWARYCLARGEMYDQIKQLSEDGYSNDEIDAVCSELQNAVQIVAKNVDAGALPKEAFEAVNDIYYDKDGNLSFVMEFLPHDRVVKTAWGDTYTSGYGDALVASALDFSDATIENRKKFMDSHKQISWGDDSGDAIFTGHPTMKSGAADKGSADNRSAVDSFVDDLCDTVKNKKSDGASDMDGSSERDKKSDDSEYETFTDKKGNQCRRNIATGETTVWVEGYDRVRKGKVEHVKSYWKVLHK